MFSGFLHLLGPCVRFIFIALWFMYFTFWLFLFYFCRLKNIIHVVQNISLPGQSTAEINAQVDLDTETVYEPTGLNFLDHDVCVWISIIMFVGAVCTRA
jgi:hypothetical protein